MDEGHFCDALLGPACGFRLDHLEAVLAAALDGRYIFLTCGDYADGARPAGNFAVLRHDVDALPIRALSVGRLEHQLGILASYFFRVHANEYNAFGFENVAVIRQLAAMGHEIGLHAEPVDLAAATGCDPAGTLVASRAMLEAVADVPVRGVACHNDVTPDNNLDYLTGARARALGFRYEAYDDENLGLFRTATYLTDGHYWRWRSFIGGRRTDDERCLCRHVADGVAPLYVLVHPHVWPRRHFHLVDEAAAMPDGALR